MRMHTHAHGATKPRGRGVDIAVRQQCVSTLAQSLTQSFTQSLTQSLSRRLHSLAHSFMQPHSRAFSLTLPTHALTQSCPDAQGERDTLRASECTRLAQATHHAPSVVAQALRVVGINRVRGLLVFGVPHLKHTSNL
jgi:hypothetical protein